MAQWNIVDFSPNNNNVSVFLPEIQKKFNVVIPTQEGILPTKEEITSYINIMADKFLTAQSNADAPTTDISSVVSDMVSYPDGFLDKNYRILRNSILNKTDRFLIQDRPIDDTTKSELLNYRQQLRDLTNQPGFPTNITWPVPPQVLFQTNGTLMRIKEDGTPIINIVI